MRLEVVAERCCVEAEGAVILGERDGFGAVSFEPGFDIEEYREAPDNDRTREAEDCVESLLVLGWPPPRVYRLGDVPAPVDICLEGARELLRFERPVKSRPEIAGRSERDRVAGPWREELDLLTACGNDGRFWAAEDRPRLTDSLEPCPDLPARG